MKSRTQIEFGDFQTPLSLTREICDFLSKKNINPSLVIEPTCGLGTFLLASAEAFPTAQLRGFDINDNYIEEVKKTFLESELDRSLTLKNQDFFTHDWHKELSCEDDELLVIGNPPWVTNSAVSTIGGSNLPEKKNVLGLKGISAMTGKSNFDISEWMLLQLLQAVGKQRAWIAILCKTATARKTLKFAWKNLRSIEHASIYKIDAKKHFNVSVDACLVLIHTGINSLSEADVYDGLVSDLPITRFGIVKDNFVSDIDLYQSYSEFDGQSVYQWRSGVKHDCASVMEFEKENGSAYVNKLREVVQLEDEMMYPLLKCTDLANSQLIPRKHILITQRKVNEDTKYIEHSSPDTWSYLQRHKEEFEARKSSIYKKSVPFGLFGIGEYAFAPWKVAISGLHPNPRFVVVGESNGKPILFDDTCYYISFTREDEAELVCEILNSHNCQEFLRSLMFSGSKRPVTVELLQRINIGAIAKSIGLFDVWNDMNEYQYELLDQLV
jgi:hypothetical protein